MKREKEQRCFGGTVAFCSHASTSTQTDMRFAVFVPPQAEQGPVPVVYWLSGLSCNDENFITKAGAQRRAAELGVMLVCPDTSPRGVKIPGDDDSWDFGQSAGFYVDATREPWDRNYNMYSYVVDELPKVIAANFAVNDMCSIMGHSMGGHGALVLALRNPHKYRSVSAFAPICAPSQVPWGHKAFGGYLGDDRKAWEAYDASALIRQGAKQLPMLVDQGLDDGFLQEQLKTQLLDAACKEAGYSCEIRRHEGYDHSYYFIASFIDDHLAHHAKHLF